VFGWLRTLGCLFGVASVVACGQHLTENHDNVLPPDIRLPSVSGDAEDVADTLCRWAEQNQKPFSQSLISEVYVSRVVGRSPSSAEAAALVRIFLQHDRNPQRLIVPFDVGESRLLLGDPNIEARITASGLWMFEKSDLERCERDPEAFTRTEFDDVRLCVDVKQLPEPPTNVTEADYRALSYSVPVGPFRLRQLVVVQLMSLYQDQTLVGRSVGVVLHAGPLDSGRVTHHCRPDLTPAAFESAG
jgi:hypothetical protein